MVGMPGSGKTYWAKKHCAEHPEKRYNILSTGAVFDKMKVSAHTSTYTHAPTHTHTDINIYTHKIHSHLLLYIYSHIHRGLIRLYFYY